MNKLLDYRESCMKEDRLKERAEKSDLYKAANEELNEICGECGGTGIQDGT